MIRFATVAAACVLAISSTSAFAAASSSATINNLSFTLIDLNPRDGIAPSFSFLSSAGSTVLSINAADDALGEADSAFRKRAGTFTFSQQFLADLSNAQASAQVGNQSLSASGAASGANTSYNASASTGANNNYYPYNNLNLSVSANTLLLINADVSLAASATNPLPCSYYYCNNSESASASASLTLSYNYYANGTSASFTDNKNLSLQASAHGAYQNFYWYQDPLNWWNQYPVYYTVPGTQEVKSLNDTLSTAFLNSSGQTQLGSLGFSVSATGIGNTAPIPEPETYALVLAGLSMVGLVARRRRA